MPADIDIQEHQFNTGVVTINYAEVESSAVPLVLLHGGSGRWQSFEEIIPNLATQWHIFAPELRGHGKSSRASHYRLQDYTDDLTAFIERIAGAPSYLFGHSLGGMIALMVAAVE